MVHLDGEGEMKGALFRRRKKNSGFEETSVDLGEITVHILPGSEQLIVTVAGRVTVDSSPNLRSLLLDLLRRSTAPLMVIDVSGVSYLDMSGIATLLEVLKAAGECSVKLLLLAGISGQFRNLAKIVQLDTIFRARGSEVEFR